MYLSVYVKTNIYRTRCLIVFDKGHLCQYVVFILLVTSLNGVFFNDIPVIKLGLFEFNRELVLFTQKFESIFNRTEKQVVIEIELSVAIYHYN